MEASLGSEADQKTAWGAVFPTNPNDGGAPLHLLVQALDGVGAVQLGPVLAREFAPVRRRRQWSWSWSWSSPGFVDGYGLENSSVSRALLS